MWSRGRSRTARTRFRARAEGLAPNGTTDRLYRAGLHECCTRLRLRWSNCAAGRIRTCSPRLRRPMPYPLGHSGLLRCQDSNLNNGLQRTVCCRVTPHLISCPTWIRTRSHGLTVRWFAFNRQGINARTSADFAVVEWRSWCCDHNTGRARMAGVESADVGFGDRATTSRSSPFTTSGWEELNLHRWYPKPV